MQIDETAIEAMAFSPQQPTRSRACGFTHILRHLRGFEQNDPFFTESAWHRGLALHFTTDMQYVSVLQQRSACDDRIELLW